MPEVTGILDRDSLADLQAAINSLIDYTGRSGHEAVTYAALRLCMSGRARAKKSVKRRDIVANPEWAAQKKVVTIARSLRKRGRPVPADMQWVLDRNVTPFHILRMRQEKDTVKIPSFDKNDPRRVIKDFPHGKRGLAKGLFNIAVGRLGSMKDSQATGRIVDEEYMRLTKFYGQYSAVKEINIRVQNRLGYLEKAYPGIGNELIAKGTQALVSSVRRALDRKSN